MSWLAYGRAREDVAVHKPYPREFRDEVVRLARGREPGVTLEHIARDLGVHMTLFQWLRQADLDDGARPGSSLWVEGVELREARTQAA